MPDDPLPALASAAEGSRELDALVAEAAGWKQARDGLWNRPEDVAEARRKKVGMLNYRPHPLPAFTTSVDAALTLVPEGWHVSMTSWSQDDMRLARCRVFKEYFDFNWSKARTIPLAICLAALKARTQNAE